MAIDVVLMVPLTIRIQTTDRALAIDAAKLRVNEWLGAAGCIAPGYNIAVIETKGTVK